MTLGGIRKFEKPLEENDELKSLLADTDWTPELDELLEIIGLNLDKEISVTYQDDELVVSGQHDMYEDWDYPKGGHLELTFSPE